MSDLCEIEQKMKPVARYTMTGFLGLLSVAFFGIISSMDSTFSIWVSGLQLECTRSFVGKVSTD